jgi:hypothetical protein
VNRRAAAIVGLAVVTTALVAWFVLSNDGERPRGDEMPAADSAAHGPAGTSSSEHGAGPALAARPGRAKSIDESATSDSAPVPKSAARPRRAIEPGTIRGVVVTDEGRPIVGATVVVSTGDGVEPSLVAFAKSDDAGRFSLLPSSGHSALDLHVSADGRVPEHRPIVAGTFVVARMGPAGSVRGRIVDSDGRRPIAGARVTIYGRDIRSGADGAFYVSGGGIEDFPSRGSSISVTDADGVFHSVCHVGKVAIHVQALGYYGQDQTVHVASDGETDVELEVKPLGRGGALSGFVRVDGAPASGALVAYAAPSRTRDTRLAPWGTTRSASDGRYRLEGVPLGQRVWVDAGPDRRGYVWLPAHDDRTVELVADLDAPKPLAMDGTVTQDGRALEGVEFSVTCSTHGTNTARSDAAGRFHLPMSCPDGNGFASARTPDGFSFNVPVPHFAPDIPWPSLDLVVPPSGRVRGRVTDREEKPIAGAHVTGGRGEVIADDDGRYEIAVAVGKTRLRAWAAGYSSQQTSILEIPAGAVVDRDLRLSPGGAVVGRVVSADHLPLADVVVLALGGEGVRAQSAVKTNGDGAFIAADVTGASFRLEFSLAGYAPQSIDDVEPDSVVPDVVMTRIAADSDSAMK